jgi:L-threonylcarbamoyladenylate synthase
MRVLPVSDEALEQAVEIIRRGGCVAHATETCYGLACDLTQPAAVARLFVIKGRPGTLPVSALFPSIAAAQEWVEWNDTAEELARKHLPGPLTLVLSLKTNDSKAKGSRLFPTPLFPIPMQQVEQQRGKRYNLSINGKPVEVALGTTLGVRVSSHPVAQALAERAGIPLSTTSANLHRAPEPCDIEEIEQQFAGREAQPDLLLDSGELPRVPPSTVVIVNEGRKEVARRGGVQVE